MAKSTVDLVWVANVLIDNAEIKEQCSGYERKSGGLYPMFRGFRQIESTEIDSVVGAKKVYLETTTMTVWQIENHKAFSSVFMLYHKQGASLVICRLLKIPFGYTPAKPIPTV